MLHTSLHYLYSVDSFSVNTVPVKQGLDSCLLPGWLKPSSATHDEPISLSLHTQQSDFTIASSEIINWKPGS